MSLPEHTTLNWGPWYRRSPFFEATLRAGCSAYDVYQHMYHPNTYGDPVEEYWALVNDVTLWDVSVERIVEITGPDASAFTNLLTCRDLTNCAVKQGKYMLVTAADGGIVNDPVLLRVEEDRWWLALADSDAGLYAMGVAVQLRARRARRSPRGLPGAGAGPEGQGHDARPVRRLDPRHEVLLVRRGRPRRHPRGDQPHRLDRRRRLRDLPARPEPRRRPVGAHPRRRQALRHPRHAVVRHPPHGSRHLRLGLRLRPRPTTRSRSRASSASSSTQEADYIGKEALERIRREGVSRKLVGIELEGEPVEQPTQHWPAAHAGERVGHVTDACWSPRLEKNIGYVWVPIALAAARHAARRRHRRRHPRRGDRGAAVHRPAEEGARRLNPGGPARPRG